MTQFTYQLTIVCNPSDTLLIFITWTTLQFIKEVRRVGLHEQGQRKHGMCLEGNVLIGMYFMDDTRQECSYQLRNGTLDIHPVFSTQSIWLNQLQIKQQNFRRAPNINTQVMVSMDCFRTGTLLLYIKPYLITLSKNLLVLPSYDSLYKL